MNNHGLRFSALALGVLTLALLAPGRSLAQYRAGIQGVVLDPQGAAVPEASVTVVHKSTNISRSTRTNESGAYAFSALLPGAYSLTVEKEGFAKKVLDEVIVQAEQVQSLNVQIELGQVAQAVTVSEPALPLLDTQGATISGGITTREIENLPSFGRDPFRLLRLAPGVFGNGAIAAGGGNTQMPGVNRPAPGSAGSIFFIENGPQIIANGTRQNANNIQIDGVTVNSVTWGGSAVVTPNEESIEEIRIASSYYTAENGRNSGAQIMVVSRHGTNEFHGSGFFKWHRPGLNAYQRWNGPGIPSPVRRDENRFNQLGGSLGGPILKDRLFAFFSYEELRNAAKTSSTVWFETQQFRSAAAPAGSLARRMLSFPGVEPVNVIGKSPLTCAQVGLPATQCQDTPAGLDLGSPLNLPLGTADPTFGKTGTPYGIGNGFDGIADVERLIIHRPSNSDNAQYNGRLDFRPTDKDLFAFSLYWVPTVTRSINGPARVMNQWLSDRLSRSYTGIWNRTFSSTIINEARFGFSGWKFDEIESNPQLPWGLPIINIDSAGTVGFQNFGAPGPGVFDQGTHHVRDTLSMVQGRHFLKLGGEFSRSRSLNRTAGTARPTFRFRNLWSYANDGPYQESGTFDPVTGRPTDNNKNLRIHNFALFIQDDWKARPNLTLNLGLRYEYYSPLKATEKVLSNPVLGSGGDALTGLTIRISDRLNETRKLNFGPQVGFAWNPSLLNKRLVFRGGFGIGFNVQQAAPLADGRANPPWATSLTLTGANVYYAVPDDPKQFSNWPANPAAKQTFDPVSGLPLTGAPLTLYGYPLNQKNPATYRYSFDVQYQVARDWVATVGYQGSQSRHLSIRRDLNLLYYPSLNPRVNRLHWTTNEANSSYNALLTQIQRRFSRMFTLDVQYRLSRITDEGSQDYYSGEYPFERRAARGPADFDVTHDFKAWGVFTPVIFKGRNNWLEKLAGGWSISGILSKHSGFPWHPTYSNTGNNVVYPNSGYGTLRPAAYSGGATQDYSNDAFMRPSGNFPQGALAYFTVPTWPATGKPPAPGVGRNSFRGPRYIAVDATLSKAFSLPNTRVFGENAKLNLQAFFYNAFNTLNLTSVNTIISTDGKTSNPLFGQAQGAFAGRIVELQARFSF